MNALHREARDGLMRAWLELLRERHPGVTWTPVGADKKTPDGATEGKEVKAT
ncbi:MAG: hypothetical protein H0U59_13990 [Gemmatimonadaceae bacterium]|nr:hypothetical protein [Gemmatimonadaceae bacterium]